MIFGYTDDAGASLGSKATGVQDVYEFNGLVTISSAQRLPADTTFTIIQELTVEDNTVGPDAIETNAVLTRHIGDGEVTEPKLDDAVKAKIHTENEVKDLAGSLVTGNPESGGSLEYNTNTKKVALTVNPPSEEVIFDIVKNFYSGNTERLITVTPQDSDNTIDFIVDSQVQRFIFGTSATVPTLEVGQTYVQWRKL